MNRRQNSKVQRHLMALAFESAMIDAALILAAAMSILALFPPLSVLQIAE